MPERIWGHACCKTTSGNPSCPACGAPGEFAGWGWTVAEAMERFQLSYGLAASGPHLRNARLLLDGMRSACGSCHGAGLVGDIYDWRACAACEGTGGIWSAPEETIREVYEGIVEGFPGCAAPGALSVHAILPPMDRLRDAGDEGADPAAVELFVSVTIQGSWGVVTHNSGPPDPDDAPAAELRRPGALIREGMIALTRVSPRDLDRAGRCFREALDLLIDRLGEPHPKVSYALDRLGLICQMRGQLDDAERLYLRSLAILDDGRKPSHWNDLTTLNLAVLYGCQGRLEERDAIMRRYVP
jgi:tetratricopeptide (TPR) repeat protein